jgi:glycosyltransferase involved in cell wall biosynthesis
MKPPRTRIALVSTYSHLSRDSIERMLKSAFPEFEVDTLSVVDIVKRNRSWILPNLWHVAKEYGGALARREMTLREAYFRTTYLFVRLQRAMQRLIDPERHLFSFQMQSIYNTSVPGVPHFIYTDHTHLSNLNYHDFDRRTLRSKEWLALESCIYVAATAVFTRSTDVARDVTLYYGIPAGKVECVYAGSNVDVDKPGQPDNDDYGNRHILFVGVDWERKGGPELLEAFRSVRRIYPDAHLTIAGADVRVDDANCTVLGKVAPDRLSRCYAEASVFCLPTRCEPFGIAFVEAMMHRLPIVATRVGAIPDMVDEGSNGFLVEPGQSDALASALCKLLASPATCRAFGQRSYEKAAERYTWTETGKRIRARIMSDLGRSGDVHEKPNASLTSPAADARCPQKDLAEAPGRTRRFLQSDETI